MWMWWSNRPSLNTNIDHHQHKKVCTNIFATLRHYCHKFYRIWQHHFELTIQPLVSVFNVSPFFSIKITRKQMVQQCWEKKVYMYQKNISWSKLTLHTALISCACKWFSFHHFRALIRILQKTIHRTLQHQTYGTILWQFLSNLNFHKHLKKIKYIENIFFFKRKFTLFTNVSRIMHRRIHYFMVNK